MQIPLLNEYWFFSIIGAIEYLYCKDGKMVETGKFCDMVNDCEDGFDEENCEWKIKETSKGN